MLGCAEIVRNAFENGVTVPAFNVPYLPMVEPVIRAVADTDTFAMVATSRIEWYKFEAKSAAAVLEEYQKWQRPEYVRLHQDHVPVIDEDGILVDYESVLAESVELGYDSIMVDASRQDLEGNIEATKKAAAIARKGGVPCESELGAVLGHEEGPLPPYEELYASGQGFTDVAEAERFVKETGCDWLSVAIGNIHGAVSVASRDDKKVEARLNLEHLRRLREVTGVPLVLHGGSGVNQDSLRGAIQEGIAKVNVGTEIRRAYETALRANDNVEEGQQAVYERTCSLITDWLGIAGTRATVLGNGA